MLNLLELFVLAASLLPWILFEALRKDSSSFPPEWVFVVSIVLGETEFILGIMALVGRRYLAGLLFFGATLIAGFWGVIHYYVRAMF